MAEAKLERLSPAGLTLDPEAQCRAGGPDKAVVAEYAEALRGGATMPPSKAVHDGEFYWVWDGHQRTLAARAAGLAEVEVLVTPGSRDEALWLATSANATHGARRRNEDKRLAVERAMLARPELSNRAIAEHVGVSHDLANEVRKALTESVSQPGRRVGRDGRTTDVSKAGKKRKKKQDAAPPEGAGDGESEAEPGASPTPPGEGAPSDATPATPGGMAWPAEALEVKRLFRALGEAIDALAKAKGGETYSQRLRLTCPGGDHEKARHSCPDLKKSYDEFRAAMPHFPACPYCAHVRGVPSCRECEVCRGVGYASRAQWERAPADYRRAAEGVANG